MAIVAPIRDQTRNGQSLKDIRPSAASLSNFLYDHRVAYVDRHRTSYSRKAGLKPIQVTKPFRNRPCSFRDRMASTATGRYKLKSPTPGGNLVSESALNTA